MVANHPSGFFDLAAAPRQPLAVTTWPTSPRKTRVGFFRHRSSGQTSSRRRCRSMFTPGSRACGYKTVSGRHEWLNRDPIGEKGSINLYLFCFDNALDIIDLFGLDTYKCNRKLGGGPPLPPLDPLSHTFTFTTGANGAVNNTYSWGNSANTHGWNYNQPEDMSAASEALGNGDATKIGNSSFDPFVNQAFNDLNKPENEHANWGVCNNCKSEANNLANLAHSLQNAAQNPPASLLNPPYDTGNVNAPPSSASSPSTCN